MCAAAQRKFGRKGTEAGTTDVNRQPARQWPASSESSREGKDDDDQNDQADRTATNPGPAQVEAAAAEQDQQNDQDEQQIHRFIPHPLPPSH